MTNEPPTKVKKAIDYFNDHPLFSKIIVIGTIIIALGAVAAALKNIRDLFPSSSAALTATFPTIAIRQTSTVMPSPVRTPQIKGDVLIVYEAGTIDENALQARVNELGQQYPEARITMQRIDQGDLIQIALLNNADIILAPNDKLVVLVENNSLKSLDEFRPSLTNIFPSALESATVDQTLYGLPVSLLPVALYYDKTLITNPPTKISDLLEFSKRGDTIAIIQGAYFLFGFTAAYGGRPFDSHGICVPEQTKWAEVLTFLKALKIVQPKLFFHREEIDRANNAFSQGTASMIINGPWMLQDFEGKLHESLGVAIMPGDKNPTRPLLDFYGIYIIKNSNNPDTAAAVAQGLANLEAQQIYANQGSQIPSDQRITPPNELTAGFLKSAKNAFPRPNIRQMNTYLLAFDQALDAVLDYGKDPYQAVVTACNQANLIKP